MRRLPILLFLTVAALGFFDRPASAQQEDKLPLQAVKILEKYCYRCHGESFKYPGLDILDRPTLLKPKDESEDPFLVPESLENSRIWMIAGEHDPYQMPPEDQPQPSNEEKQLLKRWIESGAEFPAAEREVRKYRGEDEILQLIASDLEQIRQEHRKFTRYFTLLHLWNDQTVQDTDLQMVRAAVSKLINSLSFKARITRPRLVGDNGLVMAIDLRDYGWDKGRKWDLLIAKSDDGRPGYPYGLYRGSNEARRVYELTGCDLPYIRADWFVYHASRPPHYHLLLPLPDNQKTLEATLDVNSLENFDRDRVARAAFRESGVSDQTRMVQRQEARYGAYWDSFDNEKDGGEADFFVKPLGPKIKGRNNRAAFKHAGGEVIAHLPNRLLLYYLATDEGVRIDEGPINIVRDPQQFSGTNAIVNGVSCFGCHRQGLRKFTDTLRAGYESLRGQPVADKVLKIFPPQDRMDALIKEDNEMYLQALDRAILPFLKTGPDDTRRGGDFAEPIVHVSNRYDRKLDFRTAARELLLPGEEDTANQLRMPTVSDLKSQLKLGGTFQRLGLEPLARGEVVARSVWEKSFHSAARALKLGIPQHFGN